MTYGIYFDSRTPAEALRQALHTVYNVPLDLVYAGPHEGLNDYPGPDPVALITPTGGQFAHEFSAGDQLQTLTRATELELAQAICRVARTEFVGELPTGRGDQDYRVRTAVVVELLVRACVHKV